MALTHTTRPQRTSTVFVNLFAALQFLGAPQATKTSRDPTSSKPTSRPASTAIIEHSADTQSQEDTPARTSQEVAQTSQEFALITPITTPSFRSCLPSSRTTPQIQKLMIVPNRRNARKALSSGTTITSASNLEHAQGINIETGDK